MSNAIQKSVFNCLLAFPTISIVACVSLFSTPAQAQQPNIVFIMADDLGWSDTELNGTTSFYETPNILRLADRGMTFTRAYSAHPLCSPTRASVMTGLEPGRLRFTSAQGHVAEERLWIESMAATAGTNKKVVTAGSVTRLNTTYDTLAESLKAAGYATGFFGKWHLGPEPYSPLEHGFDTDIPHRNGSGPQGGYMPPWGSGSWVPATADENQEDRLAQEAVTWMQAQTEPFFLNYWAFSVHGPNEAKPEYIAKYDAKADPLALQRNATNGGMVETLDDAVGTILDEIDALGLTNNTIIVFTSDNGGVYHKQSDGAPITSSAPNKFGKAHIYEGGTHVPTTVVWPGQAQAGSVSDAFLTSTDWFPTLLDMAGISTSLTFDGVSQVPALLGQTAPRDAVFTFVPSNSPAVGARPAIAMREGDWKLIRHFADNDDQTDRLELFNLTADIGELTNVAAANPSIVSAMNADISQWLIDHEVLVPIPNPNYDPNANAAPVASDQSVSGDQDSLIPITLAYSDPDGPSDGASIDFVTLPSNGTLSFWAYSANVTYIPNPSFTGTDSFSWKGDDNLRWGNTATVTITVNATGGGGGTSMATFTPTDDAYVQELNPTNNYGTDTQMRIRQPSSNEQHGYVKFNVSGTSGTVTNATLRLYQNGDVQMNGPSAHAVADTSWTEGAITWNNKPAMGATLDTVNNPPQLTWVEFDVTSHVTGDGLVTLGITGTTNSNHCRFATKEDGTFIPELVVTYDDGGSNEEVWVDPAWSNPPYSSKEGTQSNPLDSFEEAISVVNSGGTIRVIGESELTRTVFLSSGTLTKSMTIYAEGGVIRLEQGIAKSQAKLSYTNNDDGPGPYTFTIVGSPGNGTAYPDGSYMPDIGYIGPDTFTWKVNDGLTDSNIATFNVEVEEVIPVPASTPITRLLLVAIFLFFSCLWINKRRSG